MFIGFDLFQEFKGIEGFVENLCLLLIALTVVQVFVHPDGVDDAYFGALEYESC